MKFMALLIVVVSAATSCPKLRFDPSVMDPNDCMVPHRQDDILYLHECAKGKVCVIDEVENEGDCRPYIENAKFPGEYCEHSKECSTGICYVENRCFGFSENESCKADGDCNYGLTCEIPAATDSTDVVGKCVKTVGLGGDCMHKRCDPFLICSVNTCVEYGSVIGGEPATDWRACQSFHLHQGVCTPTDYKAKVENATEPFPAKKCEYSYTKDDVTVDIVEEPSCGNDGELYCNPPKPVIPIVNLTAYIDQLKKGNYEHHVGCGLFCKLSKPNDTPDTLYYEAKMQYLMLENWAKIVMEPSFARRVLSQDYWDAYDQLHPSVVVPDHEAEELIFLCVTGGALGLLALLSVVLGVKKCFGPGSELGRLDIAENDYD